MNIRCYDHSYHHVTSGGDVIVAEFARAWEQSGHTVSIITHPEAQAFFLSRGVLASQLSTPARIKTDYQNVLQASLAHTANAVLDAVKTPQQDVDVIFAGSWSLQDILPAVIDKRKHPDAQLAVGCYIFLAPPWVRAYGANIIHRIVFFGIYCIGILVTLIAADTIWTASPVDAAWISKRFRKKAFAVRGGVDVNAAARALKAGPLKRCDAVYIGRFHPQKNMIELIRIWKAVVDVNHAASLVIAGDGFQKNAMTSEIRRLKLTSNIRVLPAIDGDIKFRLLSESRLFVSASHFDTGNLALDEALATATPGIIYDLPNVSYPAGVARVPRFDTAAFAKSILTLLSDEHKRMRLSITGKRFADSLDWHKQAERALSSL